MPNLSGACGAIAGAAKGGLFSEAEARKQGLVKVGILLMAGLVTASGALLCSTDGARERLGVSGLVVRNGGNGGSESVYVERERNLAGALSSISQKPSPSHSESAGAEKMQALGRQEFSRAANSGSEVAR